MNAASGARRVVGRAGNSRALGTVARTGYAASGLMHLLMGYLAIRISQHQGGESDQSGAFAQMLELPGGMIIIWITFIGLTGLAVWLFLQAALGIGSSSKKRWVRSLVSLTKGATYAALASTAMSLIVRSPTNSGASARQASGTVLSLPGGQLLLVVVGLATAGIGGYFIFKGARKKFHQDIALPSGYAGTAVDVLGIAGYVAKGIAIMTLGVLLVIAAVKVDPKDASGLDGAIKALAALPFGEAILILIGVGLIAYGVYSLARARLTTL